MNAFSKISFSKNINHKNRLETGAIDRWENEGGVIPKDSSDTEIDPRKDNGLMNQRDVNSNMSDIDKPAPGGHK